MVEEFIAKFKKKSIPREELFSEYDYETIGDVIIKSSKNEVGLQIFNSIFVIKDDLLLFEIIKHVLPRLNRDDLKTKQLNDFYSRVCIELSKASRSPQFMLEIAYLCEEFISVGDPRAFFHKDVLPIAITVLQKYNSTIKHKGRSESGRKYSQEIIDNILDSSFPVTGLTALVAMFKDIELTQQQHEKLIIKVSQSFNKVPPQDIGSLALATFQTALFNQLLLPILALDKYFHKHRYRKEINESASDFDSIDDAADAGIIEVEEIVIYHFQDVAEYTTIERDLTNAIKSLEHTPRFILTPFISTLLMSIAKISSSVEGNFRLNQSFILPLLKQMFKFNEEHEEILRTSGWASSIDQMSEIVNTDTLLRMLKQNSCALKQNIALNGLFGLSFLLLKTKASPELNKFSIEFLNEVIRNRQEFTSDIMKIVVKMLFCEKNKIPIVQCISTILQNRYLDINSAKSALISLIEDLTELDIDTAIAIESAIFAAIQKSIDLRDHMIEVMKTAMYQKNPQVRKMAIFSFCLMLRKFTKPPRLSSLNHNLNESRFAHNISFFSLTQSQIPINNVNSNVRQVEIMMLEILGMLRKCFSDNRELRVTLYENLLSSITANPFIVSSVLEFIEGHFRDYFDCEGCVINFDRVIKANNEASDDLGCLLKFIINCVIIATFRNNRENLNYDLSLYKDIINKLIEKISNATLSSLKLESLDQKHTIIIPQLLNCIENLMFYCLDTNYRDDDYLDKILILFEKHQKIREHTKKLLQDSGKGKKKSDSRVTTEKLEINYSVCIWDLKECASFLKLITFRMEEENPLKTNKEFCKFIWQSTCEKIQIIQAAGEHSKMRHSRSSFDSFLSCTTMLFDQLDVEFFSEMFSNFNFDCIQFIAEGIRNAAQVLQTGFYNKKEKFSSFLRAVTKKSSDDDLMLKRVIDKITKVIEWGFEQEKEKIEFVSTAGGNGVLCCLFTAIQIFSNNFQYASNAQDIFNWILNFSKNNNVKQKNLATTIMKLLLQSISQHENSSIIDCIAHKISSTYKYRVEMSEPENASQNNYTIISKHTVDEALVEFIEFIRNQLNIIEVYIKRANSFNAHARLKTENYSETVNTLINLEIAIAIKLISLGESLERLINSTFPLQSSRHIEKLTSIIRAYYNCMTNLMKHFKKHYNIKNISNECIAAVEKLLRYSRTFAKAVYALVKYVGSETSSAAKTATKDDKTKSSTESALLKKTKKSIPKIIFMLETFHKSVNDFDQASKTNLSRLLHPGEVRDFHIDTNFIANDNGEKSSEESDETSSEEEEGGINRVTVITPRVRNNKKRKALVLSENSSDDDKNTELNDEDAPLTRERFEENLRKMQVSKATSKKKSNTIGKRGSKKK